MPARGCPLRPVAASCPGRRGSGAHARAPGGLAGGGGPLLPSPSWLPSGAGLSWPLSPGSAPRLVPSLRGARTPHPCAPSRGRGTSEAQGCRELRPRGSGPAPGARPRRSLRAPRPLAGRAPRRAQTNLEPPGTGARVQSPGPPGLGTAAMRGGSGPGPRDYFSFESFQRPKVWSGAAEGSSSGCCWAQRQLATICISIAEKWQRGAWGRGVVPGGELSPGRWGGATKVKYGRPPAWTGPVISCALSSLRRAPDPGAPPPGAPWSPLRSSGDRGQTPLALTARALDLEGRLRCGRNPWKGSPESPKEQPRANARPDGLRTRSPRRTPRLDSPRSLSCPFSWPLPPKVFRKAPGSGRCWRWCNPGPSHVLLPAGLFLRRDAGFGHPVPWRAKRWASKMPALVLGDQSSRPHSGDRQPTPSQPRVVSALAGGSST